MDLSSFESLLNTLKNKRYETDFFDKEKIGRGGFASVYKAKNCLDDHSYAIKKIKLTFKDIQNNFNKELQRILSEAKVLASVNHPNIIRYYNCWLEATTKKRKPLLKLTSISTKFNQDQDFSDNSPFVLNGLEDSEDEGSPCVIFESSSHTNPKLEAKNLNLNIKPKKSHFAKASDCFDDKKGNNEDFGDTLSGQALPKNLQAKEVTSTIPKIGDEIIESISLYIQTELCNETLEDYITKRNQRLNKLKLNHHEKYLKEKKEYLREAFYFAKQIAIAVSHIHSQKIVHRDLKPGNIFLSDKTVKIGDFGLVKRLQAFAPMEASPFMGSINGNATFFENSINEFTHVNESETGEIIPDLCFQKATSDPVYSNEQSEIYFEVDDLMTKSVGTRTFASPEQLKADKQNFDQRSDIFSLGLVYLLLFHPMKTLMEQHNVIKDCKNGKVPIDLEKEVPEIAKLIMRMLSNNPSQRPSLDEILRNIYLPLNNYADFSGKLLLKKENSESWRSKYFRLIDSKLFIFEREEDKKAEQVHELSQWNVLLKENNTDGRGIAPENYDVCNTNMRNWSTSTLVFENPMQLGFWIKTDSQSNILSLYQKLRN